MGKTTRSAKPTQLPLYHFAAVSRTIRSILAPEKNVSHNKACVFYAIIGSLILDKHYGIKARPLGGGAIYALTDVPDVLAFALPTDKGIITDEEHFHFWVETPEFAMDFMAPYFPEVLAQDAQRTIACPRKAFQSRITDAASGPNELRRAGDFLHLPNAELTEFHMEFYRKTPLYQDWADLAVDWYRPPPKSMKSELLVGDAKGNVTKTPLLPLELEGFW